MLKAAIIGAGSAGLASARAFLEADFEIQVFEQASECGGLWLYSEQTEDDLLGQAPRQSVHSSLYASLRTNLPSDLMAFLDYPFDSQGGGEDEWPRYPPHQNVLTYLQNFARDFDLLRHILFQHKVLDVHHEGKWSVTTDQGRYDEFDAVVVCNGHFSKPRLVNIAGEEGFEGRRFHSHNYRKPETFTDRRVAVLGKGASGADIALEIATEASKVVWCGFDAADQSRSISLRTWPSKIQGSTLYFPEGQPIDVDDIVYCTGYHYHMPFLDNQFLSIEDNYVSPLYRDILLPEPFGLGIIGLPFLVVPFPLYAIQAKWLACRLSEGVPSQREMLVDVATARSNLQQAGVKQRHFHRLGDAQAAYYNVLANECGAELLPQAFVDLGKLAQQTRLQNPSGFRDQRLSLSKQQFMNPARLPS